MQLEPASRENKNSSDYQKMRGELQNSKKLNAVLANATRDLTPNQLAAIRTAILERHLRPSMTLPLFQKYPKLLPKSANTTTKLPSAFSELSSGGKRTHKKRRSKKRQTHRRHR